MYGYWGLGMWGDPVVEESKAEQEMKETEYTNENPYLRITHEVKDYDIHATDVDVGEVLDFIFYDST